MPLYTAKYSISLSNTCANGKYDKYLFYTKSVFSGSDGSKGTNFGTVVGLSFGS